MKRSDLDGRAEDVAPALLGALLSHRTAGGAVSVRITEVEAYGGVGSDPASHAHRGLTPRNEVMFAAPGTLYVYFVYGMHWCANVVCAPRGEASAVLLRAGEVVDGVLLARDRRPAARRDSALARGPANLAAALGITGSKSGTDLLTEGTSLRLSSPKAQASAPTDVGNGPRVGISQATDRPWRWWVKDDPTVSRYRGLHGDTQR
jgi:DNA-3-methyladenine glycosylase